MAELHWGTGPYRWPPVPHAVPCAGMERPVRLHGAGFAEPAPAKAARPRDEPRPAGRPATGRKQKERGMLRLDDDTFALLNERAASDGKPRADVIRDAIRHWCTT